MLKTQICVTRPQCVKFCAKCISFPYRARITQINMSNWYVEKEQPVENHTSISAVSPNTASNVPLASTQLQHSVESLFFPSNGREVYGHLFRFVLKAEWSSYKNISSFVWKGLDQRTTRLESHNTVNSLQLYWFMNHFHVSPTICSFPGKQGRSHSFSSLSVLRQVQSLFQSELST